MTPLAEHATMSARRAPKSTVSVLEQHAGLRVLRERRAPEAHEITGRYMGLSFHERIRTSIAARSKRKARA
jgi:hypothetical protein